MVLDADSTSQSIYLVVLDSSSTTGGRKTGLAYNTASLTAYYTRAGGSATAITLATLAAANSAYSSGGFKEVDATNAPGLYRLDIPDAALVNGVNSVNVVLRGASGMVQVEKEISLRPLVPSVNVSKWLGTACATPTVAGVPEVDITHAGGTAITVAAGIPEVKVNNIAANAITATSINADAITAAAIADGAIDRATFAADTGLQSARSNTAQAGAAGTITLDASASATTDFYVGMWIYLTGGTGVGQARVCTAYDGTTKVATIAPNWATNPDVTSTFAVIHAAQITGVQGNLTGSVGSVTGAVGSVTGNVGGNVTGSVGSVVGAVGSVTGNVGGNVTGSVGSVVGAVGSVTGNVGGNVTGSVGSVAAGGITASSIATDAIDADALAANAVTEIATGVWGFVVQGTRTATKAVRLMLAALTGKASGLGTATAVYRNPEDTIDAITATVDASGNRTAVTLDDSA